MIKIALGNSFMEQELCEGSRSCYNWGISFTPVFSFHAKHDPKAMLQFPTSPGGFTMALLDSWVTYNSILRCYLAFNRVSGFPWLSLRAAFLEMELPALNDCFNIWV